MLKKTIKYTDYNGVERTEDFYFNLNKMELLTIQSKYKGGFDAVLNKARDEKDVDTLLEIFKDIILSSYGIKSEDGKRFQKNKEILSEFEQSPAFENLFLEIVSNEKSANEFVTSILPKDLMEQAKQQIQNNI